MLQEAITALRMFALSLAVCSGAYPLLVLGFAKVAVPEKAEGSLVRDDAGTIVGSRLIAQRFTRPDHFWPRPSAVDYNAAAAGGSNLSPANPELTARAREIIGRLGLPADAKVPPDLVTASGSGLDPHVTPAAAEAQVDRVAAARGIPSVRVKSLVRESTVNSLPRTWDGVPLVNVLELNLALDRLTRGGAQWAFDLETPP